MPDDLSSWRNRVAVPLANWVLRLATPSYRTRIEGLVRVGLMPDPHPAPSADEVRARAAARLRHVGDLVDGDDRELMADLANWVERTKHEADALDVARALLGLDER